MFYSQTRKALFILAAFSMGIFLFQNVLAAEDIVTNRKGSVKITRPDGTVLTIKQYEPLPYIPSGSTLEVLSGSMDIACGHGFIQVVVGNSTATVKVGDRVRAGIDSVTGMANFKVVMGQIGIVTGNTTTTVKTGQEVKIGLDKKTGVVEVRSIKGAIETVTVGVKALIPDSARAKISADAGTKEVHVESIRGDVVVTSIEGKVIMLAKAESLVTEGYAEGEIQTFGEDRVVIEFVAAEEPSEPEVPEASPHRP